MSDIKYTPGPWHWEADAVKDDPTGRVRYQVVAFGKTVTRVYYSSYEGAPTNAESDARLIAAAPDLLEALQAAVDYGAMTGAAWVIEKAVAAIAKAGAA